MQPSVIAAQPGTKPEQTGISPSVGNATDGGCVLGPSPLHLSLGSEELQSEISWQVGLQFSETMNDVRYRTGASRA